MLTTTSLSSYKNVHRTMARGGLGGSKLYVVQAERAEAA